MDSTIPFIIKTTEPIYTGSLAQEVVNLGNLKYGIIFALTTLILGFGAFTIHQVYKSYRMDTETKVLTHVIAFILLAFPLYFWTNSLINLVHINCFTNYYIHKEIGRDK